MRHTLTLAVAPLLLVACATQKGAEAGGKKSGEPEKLSVTQVMFDTAACAPRALALPATANAEALLASLLMARPMLTECFIGPAHRGPALDTAAKVKLTVSEAGPKVEVSGTNLTPAGTACLEAALKRLTLPPLAKGEKEVAMELPLSHGAGSPAVKLGLNVASDVVGNLRAVQPAWCDCYQAVGTTPPPTIAAAIKLTPPAPPKDEKKDAPPPPPPPVEVTMKAPAGELSAKLSQCLEAKVKAAPFPPVPSELQVTYAFLLTNSYATGETPEVDPVLQFQQVEAIRGQRVADVVASAARKTAAALDYDAAAKRYTASKDFRLIKELKEKCAQVLVADDGWLASLRALLETDQKALGMAQALGKKDALAWAPVEAGLSTRIAETTEQLPKAQAARTADAAACPKVK